MARALLFAGVFHFLVLPQIGGTRKALGLLGGLDPLFLVGAVALEVLALLAYAQLTRSLLPPTQRPRLWRMFRIVLSSLAVNHVVPGGAAAGGVLQYRLLTRSGVDTARASFAMAAQSLGSALMLNVLLWVGLVISIPTTGFQPLYAAAAGIGAVLLAVAAFAVIALTRGRTRTLRVIAALAERTPRLDAARVTAAFGRAADQLTTLGRDPKLAATAIGWAAANWLLDAAVLWLFIAAFGHRASIPGLLVAYGLANVLAAIPLSPGGLGVIETTLILTLIGFGTPRAAASLGVAAYRLVQFWLPIPAGAAAWATLAGGRKRDALAAMVDHTNIGE
ncbi:MAG: lysylphosphatidylglycerol synthase transmembrane domain-containing protein [Acidimicrobiales bacterium]|nr:lysylphosphatidylglycerol synthase transmembrane domain-containing protein [Acidimicrobiales bacterium]